MPMWTVKYEISVGLTFSVRSVMVEGKRPSMWTELTGENKKTSCHFFHAYTLQLYEKEYEQYAWFDIPPQLVKPTLEWYFIQLRTYKFIVRCSCFSFFWALSVSHVTKNNEDTGYCCRSPSHMTSLLQGKVFPILPASYGDEPLERSRTMSFFSNLLNRLMSNFEDKLRISGHALEAHSPRPQMPRGLNHTLMNLHGCFTITYEWNKLGGMAVALKGCMVHLQTLDNLLYMNIHRGRHRQPNVGAFHLVADNRAVAFIFIIVRVNVFIFLVCMCFLLNIIFNTSGFYAS